MVAAMQVGMVALGAAQRSVLALAGLRHPTQYPEVAAREMAFGTDFVPVIEHFPRDDFPVPPPPPVCPGTRTSRERSGQGTSR